MISGTITDQSGRTLTGQTPEAFYNSLRHAAPLAFGLNCALGPDQLRPYLQELSTVSEYPVSCHPNAGLPNEFGGYDLTPEDMATTMGDFARSGLREPGGRMLRDHAGPHRGHRRRRRGGRTRAACPRPPSAPASPAWSPSRSAPSRSS